MVSLEPRSSIMSPTEQKLYSFEIRNFHERGELPLPEGERVGVRGLRR
jgi:hypothetical protein